MRQDELNKLVGTSSGFLESQPKAVRRRVAYLEELQEDHDELQDKYEEEMAALEKKYRDLQGARAAADSVHAGRCVISSRAQAHICSGIKVIPRL